MRALLVGLMFASLLMSVGIGDAFGDRAWLFVTGYLLLQVGRAASSSSPCAAGRSASTSSTTSSGRSSPAAFGSPARCRRRHPLGPLGAGGGVDLRRGVVAALVPRPWSRDRFEHTEISGEHLVERFRLFFIIALGETVLVTGTRFTDQPFEAERLVVLVISFAGTVALWWCYFQRAEAIGIDAAESADDAGAVGWEGTWTLTLIVIALIGIAVGDELAIAHPRLRGDAGFTILTFGGPALFLLAQIVFLRSARARATSRLLASRRWRSSPSPPRRSR